MPSVVCQGADEVVQWRCHLCEVGDKGWPVVFLQVDVHRIVATPWRPQVGGPETLQVGGNTRGTGTGDQQVTTILEIEGFEITGTKTFPQQAVCSNGREFLS